MPASLSDIELLTRLVAFPSVSATGTREIAAFICDYVDGPHVRIVDAPSEDGLASNLIISAGPADESGEGLTLSGHMDVVPAEEPTWTSSPFEVREDGGRLYGRGTADMKGFLALAINRFRARAGQTLDVPLALLLTFDEELGSVGARGLVEHWPMGVSVPRSVLVGEPTELRAVRMHKGHLKARITCHGVPAHSGYPHLGRNAIASMGRVLAALARWEDELAQEHVESGRHYPLSPVATVNPAVIHGGEAINIIPERCSLEVGVRLLPGMKCDAFEERLRSVATASGTDEEIEFELIGCNPPLLTSEAAPLHATLCDVIGQQETHALSLASDGGPLAELGFECVLYGPGSIETAHKADEFMPITELEQAGEVLDALIERMCMPTRGEAAARE